MKRCPECNSLFPDAEHFCELDGAVLVAAEDRTGVAPQPKSSHTLLPIAVVMGILLGVVLSLLYFAMSRQTAQENSNTTGSTSSAQQQQVVQPLQRAPAASPSVEASVEPSPSPSVESPSPQSSPAQVELSSSDPISTAGAKGIPVVIRLNSGLTIEADEAWQTGEGIWYRKHGIVTLLDPKNVKAVERVQPATPQPSASASPSPK